MPFHSPRRLVLDQRHQRIRHWRSSGAIAARSLGSRRTLPRTYHHVIAPPCAHGCRGEDCEVGHAAARSVAGAPPALRQFGQRALRQVSSTAPSSRGCAALNLLPEGILGLARIFGYLGQVISRARSE